MFRREEDRVIKSKPYAYMALKFQGEYNPITVNRAVYLKNNYCLYDNDSILYICENKDQKVNISNLFNELNVEKQYNSLFSFSETDFHLMTIDEIINDKDSKEPVLSGEERKELLNSLKKEFPLELIEGEVDFIKSNKLSKEEYMNISRRGTGIRKNSKKRREAYELYLSYEERLKNMGKMDYLDLCIYKVNNIKNKYTHVFLENPHKLAQIEIAIVKNMVNEGTYSTFTGIFPVDRSIRPKKILDVASIHTFNIKNKVEIREFNLEKHNPKVKVMDYFKFIDLKHRRELNFKKDPSQYNELILMEGSEETLCGQDELLELNVYSDIAAGEPILMAEDFEQTFNIPTYWIKNSKDCFMLKVKGDSMIGADIKDGDLVVIRKQSIANNGEIVAAEIDGSATLKRLSLGKKGAFLNPENPRYEPINMREREASIIGVALGIIKDNN